MWDGGCVAQCPHEGCEGSKAFFYQVQIRSADEPMTTFYKVGCYSLLSCFPFSSCLAFPSWVWGWGWGRGWG